MRAKALPLLLLLVPASSAAAQSVCPMPTRPGRHQSPVDIRSATPTRLHRLATRYPASRGALFNTGSNVQVNVASGGSITVDSTRFDLQEFHFHWPAEHELVGDRPAAEIHMVHADADERLAVVGTWVRVGAHNAAWDEIWSHLPAPGGDTTDVTVNIAALFGFTDLNAERVYRYCGSLTTGSTEPYAEGVTWLMRRTAITMSVDQLRQLREVMRRYSRVVQPLHGREIRYRRP
jgi:carbonic anhydrase